MFDLDAAASSPNASNVLATSSTLSRYELATSLASRTVSKENSLELRSALFPHAMKYDLRDKKIVLDCQCSLDHMWLSLGIDFNCSLRDESMISGCERNPNRPSQTHQFPWLLRDHNCQCKHFVPSLRPLHVTDVTGESSPRVQFRSMTEPSTSYKWQFHPIPILEEAGIVQLLHQHMGISSLRLCPFSLFSEVCTCRCMDSSMIDSGAVSSEPKASTFQLTHKRSRRFSVTSDGVKSLIQRTTGKGVERVVKVNKGE